MLSWFTALNLQSPVAYAICVLAMVIAGGLALGSLRCCGIALGSAGVLFVGLLFGHFGQDLHHEVLHFVKEFGLVLFVFTIGLQLGPGFMASLRADGIRLNLLAGCVILGGSLLTALVNISKKPINRWKFHVLSRIALAL